MDAVKQGLSAKRQREEEEEEEPAAAITDDEEEGKPNSLVTLSGDMVVEESSKGWNVQAKSEFATMALVFEQKPSSALYWEIKLETGGLAQVGWADLTRFRPNSESGDGVGDDDASYAFDGSRKLVFHGGKEQLYSKESWKPGDIIGCLFQSGALRFTQNGNDLGEAFQVDMKDDKVIVPALSCNRAEILELHIRKEQMAYMPSNTIAVADLMEPEVDPVKPSTNDSTELEKTMDSKRTVIPDLPDSKAISSIPPAKKQKPALVQTEKLDNLDLDKVVSVEQLMKLGIDRLKGALRSMQVKCG
mmetsp:Transcript_12635/g.21469  ORF Transcript_12635/g.21469 Transcript_12635/m.21469 type:complete len:303 (-) Transcript_12635:478-1386(-)